MKTERPDHCMRCGRQYRDDPQDAGGWNIDFDAGYAKGLVCPGCQTDLESLGAEIDTIDLEGSRSVDWTTLGDEERGEIIMQAIEQRCRRVIDHYRGRAEMAGETHMAVDTRAWATEAIDGAALFKGQSPVVLDGARKTAEEVIRAMLGLESAE